MITAITKIKPLDHKVILSNYDDIYSHFYRIKALLSRNEYTSFDALYKDFSFGVDFSSQTKLAFQNHIIIKFKGKVVLRANIKCNDSLCSDIFQFCSKKQARNERQHKKNVADGTNKRVPKQNNILVTARVNQ
jgi:hypothetical protein